MRRITAVTLLLFFAAGIAQAEDVPPRRFVSEAHRSNAPAPPAQSPVADEATTPGEQFFGDQPSFPSPNEARRTTTVQFVSSNQEEPIEEETPPVEPAPPIAKPAHLEAEPAPAAPVLAEPQANTPIHLEPPAARPLPTLERPGANASADSRLSSPMASIATIGGSLAVVLGLFFIMAWFMRRNLPRGNARLPDEIVQVLGQSTLGNRQPVQLIRCGNKLVLLATTPQGLTPLTEITDPLEVDRLAGLCLQSQPYSATQAFGQLLHQQSSDSTGNRNRTSGLDSLNDLAASRLEQLRAQTNPNG